MAGIDKTYTDSYEEYLEFSTWADAQIITFFDGYQRIVGDYVYSREKEDFDGEQVPIMNSPDWIDAYLIQNCKFQFVLDRMKDVYSPEKYEILKNADLSAKFPEDFKQGRKIRIRKKYSDSFRIHSKPYGKFKWWLDSDSGFDYNDESKKWVHEDQLYPSNTTSAYISSLKAVIRHLRKQYLPKGATFTLSGRLVGEEYLIVCN